MTHSPIDLWTDTAMENAVSITTQHRHMVYDLIGIRTQSGYTTDQVAHAIGYTTQAVDAFEQDPLGNDVPMAFLCRYAHAIGAQLTLQATLPT